MEQRKMRTTWMNCSKGWDTRWWNTQTSQERYFTKKGNLKPLSGWFSETVTDIWLFVFSQEIDEAVIKFSKHPKLKETDSVMVVIMSHGKLGAVLGVNWTNETSGRDEFPIDNIYKHLGSEKCPALLNKPKIIIIQACRGGDCHLFSQTHQTSIWIHLGVC